MNWNWIALAVPFFGFLMAVEYFWSRRRGLPVHRLSESVANLNVGIAERLADLFTTGAFYQVFDAIYRKYALFDIPGNALTWIGLFLLTDLVWYWYHRFGHEVNLFWSAHVVHHQSEDYNFTVSARITVFQSAARGLFWCVLPLVGFPPGMITTMLLLHGAYPFFTHTQLVGRLGILEWILVTPSHHRVHHSSNPEYLDKNYGDVLIIWDKLFGTFAREERPPVYGLTQPLNSSSFLWQHFHFMLELAVAFRLARGWRERVRVVLGRPDDIDPRIRLLLERRWLRRNRTLVRSEALNRLVHIQTALTLGLLFLLLLFGQYFTGFQLLIAALFLLLSVIATGALLEQKRWVFYPDFIRLHLAGLFVYSFYPLPVVSTFLLGISLMLIAGHKQLFRRYQQLVYTG
ncbi:MAG TPA: sterol desaturase family protein [Chitinophagaceae bacterium]|jgi:sterol desaturase/sphingolipid hydroxylase (fatty acid hydroxylase superfamily)|nr:sterol desaturase family protein [Chitinophagaceae bacterium]